MFTQQNRKKTLIFFSFTMILGTNLNVLSKSKICEIKYSGQKNLKAIEKKINLKSIDQLSEDFKCYKIGVEHDKFKRPIPTKPIYACCKDI